MNFDLSHAIKSLYPGAQFVLKNDSYEQLDWKDTFHEKPSKEILLAEVDRLQAEYDKKEYQRLRAVEYPSIKDQLDMLYWDHRNGTSLWLNTIEYVKQKHPKSE
jgi:tRNA A37 N6-isopentenylltransferase MiaA